MRIYVSVDVWDESTCETLGVKQEDIQQDVELAARTYALKLQVELLHQRCLIDSAKSLDAVAALGGSQQRGIAQSPYPPELIYACGAVDSALMTVHRMIAKLPKKRDTVPATGQETNTAPSDTA